MGIGAVAEPLVVVTLLFGGTWINRNLGYMKNLKDPSRSQPRGRSRSRRTDPEALELKRHGVDADNIDPVYFDGLLGEDMSSRTSSSSSLLVNLEPKWRKREIRLLGLRKEVTSPNTKVFQGRLLSRLLQRFPFLVEAWYWALIYWVYQLGRALTAVTLTQDTVDVAREHALQLVHIEKRLHMFWEVPIQHFFLERPLLMLWINRIYSFIHIPGTIAFLVWLYYYTTTRNRPTERQPNKQRNGSESQAGPILYEARRRTMAVCNLIAFIVFTAWPCMPPRLLGDEDVPGAIGREARSYGFVDTVHSKGGEASVWTQNKFCNQYAAMPSLHFGYSLLIGLTVATIPTAPQRRSSLTLALRSLRLQLRVPSWRRLLCLAVGFAYPLTILVAIVATANHFILDAVAGALVCAIAWHTNGVLLNLLWLEDWFLWCVRIHKPVPRDGERDEKDDDDDDDEHGDAANGFKA